MERTCKVGSVSTVGALLAVVTFLPTSRTAIASCVCPAKLNAITIGVQNAIALDHETGEWIIGRKLKSSAPECEAVSGDKAVVAPAGEEFKIVVFNTNGGLFSCSLKAESIPVEEVAALRTFLTGLGPYFLELKSLGAPIAIPSTEDDRARNMVIDVRSLMTGPGGIIPTYYALTEMAKDLGPFPHAGARDPATFLSEPVGRGAAGNALVMSQIFVGGAGKRVLQARQGLAVKLRELASRWPELVSSGHVLQATTEAVEKTLAEGPNLLAFARRTEELGKAILDTDSQWESEPMKLKWDQGKKVTLTIARRDLPELTAVPSDLKPREAQVAAMPDWLARPGVGLALLHSPDSTFPKYTVTGAGADATVTESGTQDSRLTYGLTLGLTWRGGDWRSRSGWAVWMPEISINPSSDVKAVGLGVAVSWRVIKIGVGTLWTKHQRLDGTKVVDTYHGNKPYVSISIIGWQPFVPKT